MEPDGRANSTRGKFGAPLHFLHSAAVCASDVAASEATLTSSATARAWKSDALRLLRGSKPGLGQAAWKI